MAAGCQTYPPTSFQVCGVIRDKYNQMNGPNSFLLFPKSNELTNPNNTGKRSEFVGGNIYWSTATGAHPVAHDFLTKWGEKGYEGGYLKYPTTDEIPISGNLNGRRQEYQGGSIYFSQTTGAHTIQGAIKDKWVALGSQTGVLGYPTGDEIVTPDGAGRFNRFEHGVIYWSAATGARMVTGTILNQWASAGYERSGYGYPTADQTVSAGAATEQQFQRGRIYSPGQELALGTTGEQFSLGLPSTANNMQATSQGNGVNYTGPGFDFGFNINTSGLLSSATLTLKDSSAPRAFKLLVGMPEGYSLQAVGSKVNILNGSGTVVGNVRPPVGISSARQGIPVQASVAGNLITYQVGTTNGYPGQIRFLAGNTYDDLSPGFETSVACVSNPYDCARAFGPYSAAYDYSEQDFPELVISHKNYIGQNNAIDADRHCLWQALTTEAANEDFAKQMGEAHESDVPGGRNAGIMDQYNNDTGRAVGLAHELDITGIRNVCKAYADNPRVVTDINTVLDNGNVFNGNVNDLIVLGGEANEE